MRLPAPREAHDLSRYEPEFLTGLYTDMLRIRLVEEKIAALYPEQEMRSPVHLYIGEEAIAVGVSHALAPDDYTFGTYRGHGLYLARGGDLTAMMAELYGRDTGCARGRGGSMHLVAPEQGVLGCSAIVGGTIPLAAGAALAAQLSGSGRIAASFFGDGAADEGVLYETLSFAALRRLPVLFVCENNGYATHSPQSARQPKDNIHERAEAFGVPGVRIDGNDVLTVYQVATAAVRRARAGDGPTLLECRTYRWKEHVGPNPDWDLGYRSEAELQAWQAACPIETFREALIAARLADPADLDRIAADLAAQIETSVRLGQAAPFPDPATLSRGVYAE